MIRIGTAFAIAMTLTPTPVPPQRSSWNAGLARLQARIQSQSLPEPEDSMALRVLVQLLASIGILSIDLAAADVADPLWISVWAIPASAIGAVWSWHRRRKHNIGVKFCIAIAMLVALAAFFINLLQNANDTRLALAELLIQLQVFHCFDLPRRKDLGYSMVIGLILLGVSATLSQTLSFGVLLLLFLAIAIPALILDYRSRLGVGSRSIRQIRYDLSLKRLGGFLAITLALGLLIFAFLPRLPGYQLRTFPVSAPINFEGQFDSSTIINPGYVREGRDVGGFGGSGSGSGSDDNQDETFDKNYYYGFNSRINQNLRGELTPRVVMRVRSQSPGFFRVMAFDHYTGEGWEVSRNADEQIEKLERPTWSYRFNVPWSVTLTRRQEVVQSFTMVSELPNVIPALYEPKALYFPTRQVGIDAEGALRSPVPLSEGLTYTVVSEVPYRERSLLRQAKNEYPVLINRYYLDVPESILNRVRQQTQEILETSPNVLTDSYETSLYLAQYLKQNYTIQPDLPPLEDGEDLVEAFLFKYKGGYPDHFSTVLTVMLRSIGIPARLVVGFGSGDFNPFTGYYVVRNTDAYAMTEVFFPKYGWFAFNPIPGPEVVPQSIEESQTFSVLRRFWQWLAGILPSPVAGVINQILEWVTQALGTAIAFLTNLMSRGWIGILLGSGLITLLTFGGWLLWRAWQLWRRQRWLRKLAPMDALYQQLLHWLTTQGLPKSTAQTPLEYMEQVRDRCPPAQADVIHEISMAYVHWRYGQQPANLDYLSHQFKRLQKRPLNPQTRPS